MDLKRCFKCLRDLPRSQFYRHHMMADGLLSKCVDCTRADARSHRDKNIDRVRAYDRERSSQPHRQELRNRVSAAWDQRFPTRHKAHNKAGNAVRDGRLERKTSCEACGRDGRIEKHHPDYSKPLLVLWLCKPCHAIADKVRRLMEKESA